MHRKWFTILPGAFVVKVNLLSKITSGTGFTKKQNI